jgi:hypothetical protein
MILDAGGNLYELTGGGGAYDYGVVYEMNMKGELPYCTASLGRVGQIPSEICSATLRAFCTERPTVAASTTMELSGG